MIQKMNVLYTCDNNYVWLMGISALSLFENNKELDNITVYLLGENISDKNKRILIDIGKKYKRNVFVIDVPKMDIPRALVSSRWPLSAFTRLYAGKLLPDSIDKILYLDCDTIIKGRLSDIEKWDVSGKVFWGVKDCIGKEYKKNIGIGPYGIYVNAGVLLCNLSELRKISINDKLNSYMKKYERLINYADQDILNGAFNGSIGILPPQYNVMTIVSSYSYTDIIKLRKPTSYYSESELNEAVHNPILIHYTTNMRTVRPWYSNTDHPFANEFRFYFNRSPWCNRRFSEMTFTSIKSKIIGTIEMLPCSLAKLILGILHSSIKPRVTRLKAWKMEK